MKITFSTILLITAVCTLLSSQSQCQPNTQLLLQQIRDAQSQLQSKLDEYANNPNLSNAVDLMVLASQQSAATSALLSAFQSERDKANQVAQGARE